MQGGLSRKYFENFIQCVERSFAVIEVGMGLDYRSSSAAKLPPDNAAITLGPRTSAGSSEVSKAVENTWRILSRGKVRWQGSATGLMLIGPDADSKLRQAFSAIEGWQSTLHHSLEVAYGRSLLIPVVATSDTLQKQQAAYFTFGQLCCSEGLLGTVSSPVGTVLGPSDYVALCR